MGRQKRQTGFSIVGIVVVLAAIVAIGAAGWFVYQHNRVKPTGATGNSNQTNNQQTTTAPPANQKTIQVPELGIQITVPADLSDLIYRTTTVTLRNGNQATLAYFSTKALTAADPNCGTNFGPLGSLERANGQYPTEQQDETNVLDYGQLVKQFPNFYVTVGYPNAACSTSPSLPTPATGSWKSQFSGALSTIQALN